MEVRFLPPNDPDDDYFLLNCFVCEELAKPGQSHMRNYGGVVCFSCRQFFRRAHQGNRHPDFSCKNNGRCHINVANRRKCQKCRYDRCVVAGMCPQAVLTEDQKKVRFQRMLRKRGAMTSSMAMCQRSLYLQHQQQQHLQQDVPFEENNNRKRSLSSSPLTSDDDTPIKMPRLIPIPQRQPEQPPRHQLRLVGKPQPNRIGRVVARQAEPRKKVVVLQSQESEKTSKVGATSPDVEAVVWPEFLRHKVDSLQQTFERSLRTLDSRFKERSNTEEPVVSSGDLFQFSVQLSKQFQQFASLQR